MQSRVQTGIVGFREGALALAEKRKATGSGPR
jgi:hypothetical protein